MSETEQSDETPPEFGAEVESLVEGVAGLFDSLKDIFVKSKEEVVRGAQLGKVRIDVFQLRKDREHFLQRLGEEAYDLLVSGELEHEALAKVYGRIQDVDQQIVEYEEEIARIAAEQAAATAAAEEDGANEEPGEAAGEAAEAAEEPAAEEEAPAPKKASRKKKKKD